MSDTSNTEQAPDQSEVEAPAKTDWKAEAERLKAEARKWESRSKDNAKAAQRLAEFEESQKSEVQRAIDRAEAAERQLSELQSREQVSAWKTEVAEKTKVSARLLRGSSLEEIQAHAEEIQAELGASQRGPYVPSPGNIPDTPVSDDAAFARSIFNPRT